LHFWRIRLYTRGGGSARFASLDKPTAIPLREQEARWTMAGARTAGSKGAVSESVDSRGYFVAERSL
jgi:hypothetical protein